MNPNLTRLDYAQEAEAAERGNAWPQAAALWRRAAEDGDDANRDRYLQAAVRCDARAVEGGA